MKKLIVSVLLVNLLAACASQKQISEIEDKLFPIVEISGVEASRDNIKNVSSQVVNIYPARADGRRDHTQNSFRVEGRIAYQVRPDGHRDYTQNSIRVEGGIAYQVRPDGHIDWNKPHYIVVPSDTSF